MSQPFIGEIRLTGHNFAPSGWAFCNGQLISIAENETLFALIGTTYGGDGQTTFALPDLRGRVVLGAGQGPGLSNYSFGQTGGTEQVTLSSNQMPAHRHNVLAASSGSGAVASPAGKVWSANSNSGSLQYAAGSANPPIVSMAPAQVGTAGSSQPHENMPPFLGLSYIISLFGIFPSQS
jgi:microcystin-dependent protein